ncbi:Uncharacterised protein [Mycobacteroides abscessus subsp. abscessus]|nr:Uncharacterised protein [Mycobacteroides abscessus subsp. abscessus]
MRSSSDQASFIRSSPSVKCAMKVRLSTPNAAKFRAPPPGATPTSRRPMAQAIDGGDGCGQLQRVML